VIQNYGNLIFLKLGGSLITDKTRPHTPRLEVLARLAEEIAQARGENPDQLLLLGHGSGSFGHVPAKKYGTRSGVHTPQEWDGFVEVWREASELNQLVMQALWQAGLPAVALSPLASVVTAAGQVAAWNPEPVNVALQMGLLPVIYGDVIFDRQWGGTILSTEDLFRHLSLDLQPTRILLAGQEPGVWADYPACTRLLERITTDSWPELWGGLAGSAATDVTGGMLSKVQASLELAGKMNGLQIRIFSGQVAGSVYRALTGEPVGTLITKE
jgi:isopentenyl phosphate kinase